jgi:protein-S-isoprenylcysteine O-methyltransferase Ste14
MTDLTAIYRDKSASLRTKATLVCIHLLIVAVSVWLLLGGGIAMVDDLLGRTHQLASTLRRSALAAAAVLYFLRTSVTIYVFLKRRMPWSEVGTVAPWIATIDVLFAYFGGRNEGPFWLTGLVGAFLVLTGSAVNTGSELQRHMWKRNPKNAGHLYTGGLFRYARHINYFGDEVLFTGWALMTGIIALLLIPAIMALGFIFINIPALDRYLAERYSDEYRIYARKAKRFIPYVY